MMNDDLIIANKRFSSRFIMGSGKFDPRLIKACVQRGGAQIITLALRRASVAHDNITDFIPKGVTLLPNTSGAHSADEALRLARLARELGYGELIKLELIKDSKYLFPDNEESVRATKMLVDDGFSVLAYMYPELYAARALQDAGASAVMPLAAPIGSNKGLLNKDMLAILLDEISVPVIVDAGIGRPSQAALCMEMGCAAVMANTAIATASDVELMAQAFGEAIKAGRAAYLAGLGGVSECARASSPLTGFLE